MTIHARAVVSHQLAKHGAVYLAIREAHGEATLRMGDHGPAFDLPLTKDGALEIAGKLIAWAEKQGGKQ